jgi:YVTN family beta-propeller protein
MALIPGGKKLYVANGRSDSISVIDTVSKQLIQIIAVGKLPWEVVIR